MDPTTTTSRSAVADRATDTDSPPPQRRLPGVEGIWVLIGFDSMIFALLFTSFMQARSDDPAGFETARLSLNPDLGGVNTLVLLTSSWAVAMAIHALRRDQSHRAVRWLLLAIATGVGFVIVKTAEYSLKVADGTTPATGDFFMWYFVLTGIHLVHVLIGLCLLTHVTLGVRSNRYGRDRIVVPECVASFWHLVDLLWIVIFPLLYLMEAAR